MQERWGGKLVCHTTSPATEEVHYSVPDCAEFLAVKTGPRGAYDYQFAGVQVTLSCSSVLTRWDGRRDFMQVHPGMSRVLLPDRIRGEWQGEGRALGAYISTGFIERSFERPLRAMNFAHGQHQSPVIDHLLRAIEADARQGVPAGPLFIQSVILALLRHVAGSPQPAVKGGLSKRQVETLKALIESELGNGVGVEQLAAAVGVSVSHLNRAFKISTGVSPHQYVVRRRIARAQQLIRSGSGSLQEVAEQAGFAGNSHMAAVFLRMLGKPPSAFREK
jgi:AraC-like DNA-binding protein